jgi:uncharacterized membrane protein
VAKNKWRGFRSQREQVSKAQMAKQQFQPATQTQVQVAQRFYTGPIPEPEALAEYERINSGLANRIVTMAEKEQGHRHRIENRRNWAQISITLLGQILGFLISVLTIGIGGLLLYNDKQLGGFVSLVSGVVMLAGAFIYRRTRATPQATQ